jgi:hypothetical protein
MDNVFIKRLWRSLKHEHVYLKGYADGREAKAGISDWIIFYSRFENPVSVASMVRPPGLGPGGDREAWRSRGAL